MQPRGSTRPSVSKSSCTIAHHPTENGEAEPQSMQRKRIHSFGTSNGLMTCRPLTLDQREPVAELFRLVARSLSTFREGLLRRDQRLLPAAEGGEADAEVIQARREIGEEGVGSFFREASSDAEGLFIQARDEIGEEGVGSALREAPIDVESLLHRGQ